MEPQHYTIDDLCGLVDLVSIIEPKRCRRPCIMYMYHWQLQVVYKKPTSSVVNVQLVFYYLSTCLPMQWRSQDFGLGGANVSTALYDLVI